MATEAQKRANAKYVREKVKTINLRFYPAEYELYEFAKSHENASGYLKQLIREDIQRHR